MLINFKEDIINSILNIRNKNVKQKKNCPDSESQ